MHMKHFHACMFAEDEHIFKSNGALFVVGCRYIVDCVCIYLYFIGFVCCKFGIMSLFLSALC